jgi:hypothetical protein
MGLAMLLLRLDENLGWFDRVKRVSVTSQAHERPFFSWSCHLRLIEADPWVSDGALSDVTEDDGVWDVVGALG